MTIEQLGFIYLGKCACPGKPERWSAPKHLELKRWNNGNWKLLRSGKLVRYGYTHENIFAEIEEYMLLNNII